MELILLTIQAVIASIENLIEFEHIFLFSTFLVAFLILYNALCLSKFIFSIIYKRRNKNFSKVKPKKAKKKINQKNLPKRIIANIVGQVKCTICFLLKPFNFKLFTKRTLNYKEFKLFKFNVRIPFLAIWFVKIITLNVVVISIVFTLLKNKFNTYPQIVNTYPLEETYWDDYSRPIEIEFDVPINQEILKINMAPETLGTWEYEKSIPLLPFSRKAKFYPEETIYPGEKVMIYLTDLSNHFYSMDGGEHLIEFYSIELPRIMSTNPSNKAKDVPIDQDIQIQLNQKDGSYIEWEFEFDKDVEFEQKRDNSESLSISFLNNLKQSETYKLDIYLTPLSSNLNTGEISKRGEKAKVHTIEFETVAAPLVSSMEPTGTNILPNASIRVVFDDEMNRQTVEEAFSISPETEGEISWEDDLTLVFTPTTLVKETHYIVNFTQGIKSKLGGFSEEAITFEFDTIGAVRVAGWSPGYGATGISVGTAVNVTFDQQVDHSSAESKFSISPSTSGTFSWSGNTMVFHPSSNISHQTTYTVSVASGVQTVLGYDSRQNFSTSFTTESLVFTLNVPQYRQTHTFTCNVTAAAMVLSYKGASSSEMGVYNGIAKDNTACTKSGTTITYWGNPNTGYVGDINGGGDCGGYGVYWSPVSAYMSSRGVSNRIYSGWNVSGLAKEVEKGNPAVIWGQNGWASPTWRSWNSPTGQVNALNGMHSEVVVGFIGSSDNPTHIITNDPWRGRRTVTVGQFNAVWGYFNYTAVVAN
ncbi:Ig-like domain-containing protein [Patescibacteria group bacterium]